MNNNIDLKEKIKVFVLQGLSKAEISEYLHISVPQVTQYLQLMHLNCPIVPVRDEKTLAELHQNLEYLYTTYGYPLAYISKQLNITVYETERMKTAYIRRRKKEICMGVNVTNEPYSHVCIPKVIAERILRDYKNIVPFSLMQQTYELGFSTLETVIDEFLQVGLLSESDYRTYNSQRSVSKTKEKCPFTPGKACLSCPFPACVGLKKPVSSEENQYIQRFLSKKMILGLSNQRTYLSDYNESSKSYLDYLNR